MAQKFYHEPEELPSGFFEALQPLANWALAGMREIYRLGYSNGKADSSSEWRDPNTNSRTVSTAAIVWTRRHTGRRSWQ